MYQLVSAMIVDSSASLSSDDDNIINFASNFTLNVRDNAEVTLNFSTKNLIINASDNADIEFKGDTCTNVTLTASDNTEYDGSDLIARNYTINVSGKASAKIYATNSITGSVSDYAVVKYKGNPKTTNVTVSDSAQFVNDSDK